jgi:MbtH protein
MSSGNVFDDEEGRYLVLVNADGQHSLWPVLLDVPDGWRIAHGEDSRAASLSYIEENWTDMRPAGLARAMDGIRD